MPTLTSAPPPCLLHKSIVAGGEWGDEFVLTIAVTDELGDSLSDPSPGAKNKVYQGVEDGSVTP